MKFDHSYMDNHRAAQIAHDFRALAIGIGFVSLLLAAAALGFLVGVAWK